MNKSILRYALAAIAAALIPLTDLHAQAEEQEQLELEEVTVTARKREESLQQVPISITAFSTAALRARSVSNMKDLGMMIPNLSWIQTNSGGNGSGNLIMRGVGQRENASYWEPGVGLYIDGVYLARVNYIDMDVIDMERIEVLRGPQGTLFGKNTIGGAINIVSKRPGDEFSGSAEVTTGSYDRIDFGGSVTLPISPGLLSANLSASVRNRDGYFDRLEYGTNEVMDTSNDVNRTSARATISWTPQENFRGLFIFDIAKVREKGQGAKVVAFNPNCGLCGLLNILADPPFGDAFATDDNFSNYDTGGNTRNIDNWGASMNLEWDIGDYRLVSITAYRDLESLVDISPDGVPYEILSKWNPLEQDQFSQEIRLHGSSSDDKLEWVAGLYYFDESGLEDQILKVHQELATYPPIAGPLPLDISFQRPFDYSTESFAAFAQGTYAANDRLSVTGGIRFTKEEKTLGHSRNRWFLSNDVLVPYDTATESWDDLSGMASIQYQWSADMMTYLSASRGFKSGGHNGEAAAGNFVPFDPEYIWTYELGLKSEWMERRVQFNAAFFFSDYTDMQFEVTRASAGGEPIQLVGNASSAEIKGFEVELLAMVAEGFTLQASVGHSDASYKGVDPTIGITDETALPGVPKWTGSISGQYEFPLENWGTLTGRVDYSFRSKTNFDVFNSEYLWQDAYGLLNGRITLRPNNGNWSVSVFGTNLTDEEYFIGGTHLFGNLGVTSRMYERPREWGLSVNYDFN